MAEEKRFQFLEIFVRDHQDAGILLHDAGLNGFEIKMSRPGTQAEGSNIFRGTFILLQKQYV